MYSQSNGYREITKKGQELTTRYSNVKAKHQSALDTLQLSKKYDNLLPEKRDELKALDAENVRTHYLSEFKSLYKSISEEQQNLINEVASKKYPLSTSKDLNSKALGNSQTHDARMYLSAPRTEMQLVNLIEHSIQIGNIDYLNALVSELRNSAKANPEFLRKLNEKMKAFDELNGITELENQIEDISKILQSVQVYVNYLEGTVSAIDMRLMSIYKN